MTAPPVKLPCGRCGIPRPVIRGLIACPCSGPGFIARPRPQTGTTESQKEDR